MYKMRLLSAVDHSRNSYAASRKGHSQIAVGYLLVPVRPVFAVLVPDEHCLGPDK